MFPKSIRYFNKYVLNRVTRRSAGSRHSAFALVRHVGRRSGKTYETPLIVAPLDDGFVLALTYGPDVDWYRNLMASGHGTLLWHGQAIAIGMPEPIDRARAIQAFSPFEQFILRRTGMRHFALVRRNAA